MLLLTTSNGKNNQLSASLLLMLLLLRWSVRIVRQYEFWHEDQKSKTVARKTKIKHIDGSMMMCSRRKLFAQQRHKNYMASYV